MPFPSLIAHSVYPLFFNLGGRLSPVSIRDQMVRAQMIVDDAVASRLIGREPWRPLLVVGAGVAGAVAATWAADHHQVPTLLIERASEAFNRQANCTSRWIDPAQFDWTAQHWDRASCPCVPVLTPMPWAADLAHHLAAKWKIQLKSVQSHWLSVAFNTVAVSGSLLGPPNAHTGWEMNLDGERTGPHRFGAVLWTIGFGAERCDFGDFVGFPFWETDPFEQRHCGVQHTRPDIVVSGSGDGALQDLLRIITNVRSAREILERCGFSGAARRHIEREISYIDELAARALPWGPGQRAGASVPNDHEILQAQHQSHHELAVEQLGRATIIRSLGKLIRNDLPRIRLIHSCSHFSIAYGLNRFLALLLGEYLRTHRARTDIFIDRRRLAAIHHLGGVPCQGQPTPWQSCHGRPHIVDLEESNDCRHPSRLAPPAQSLVPNVLIIRHGINTSNAGSLPVITVDGQSVPPLPDIAIPRQTVSYHALR